MSNGKGDRYRKVDKDTYDENYELIFGERDAKETTVSKLSEVAGKVARTLLRKPSGRKKGKKD